MAHNFQKIFVEEVKILISNNVFKFLKKGDIQIMKQYGCQRFMGKEEEMKYQRPYFEEEKWYPEEEDEYDFEKEEKCECKKQRREEKCGCKKQRPEKEKECERKERCKVVVEPTVYCKEEKHYRHCVKHIVPVVCKQVENHHYDHEYVIEKKVVKEHNRYDHGRRNEDWCKLAGCGRGRKEDCDYED